MPTWTPAENIGTRIKDLRTALGLDQRPFGELAGVGYTQVSEWENGKATPPRGRLERLARRLELPLAIFEEGGPMPSGAVNRPVNGPGAAARVFVPAATQAALTRLLALASEAGPEGMIPAAVVRAAAAEAIYALGRDAATLSLGAARAAREG